MVKQPVLLSPKLGTISSHLFTPFPQNFAVVPRIHSSACWDNFFVHIPLDIKERDDHVPEMYFHLSGLYWSWCRGAIALGRLSLFLRAVTVNPALINRDGPGHDRRSDDDQCRCSRCCSWSSVRVLGTNLAAVMCLHNFSVRTHWHVP